MEKYVNNNPYPTYEIVCGLLSKLELLDLASEYGEKNHEWHHAFASHELREEKINQFFATMELV